MTVDLQNSELSQFYSGIKVAFKHSFVKMDNMKKNCIQNANTMQLRQLVNTSKTKSTMIQLVSVHHPIYQILLFVLASK
jgi:hypothetical protein